MCRGNMFDLLRRRHRRSNVILLGKTTRLCLTVVLFRTIQLVSEFKPGMRRDGETLHRTTFGVKRDSDRLTNNVINYRLQ